MIRKIQIADLEQAPNIQVLLAEYAAESAIAGLPHPSAKVETYKHLETVGALDTFAAFVDDELVGYITVLTSVLPHYSERVAVSESFFVAKNHRKTGAGIKLLKTAEAHAKEMGAIGFLVSAPLGGTLAEVLPNVGYVETNRVFFKGFSHE